MQPDAAVLEQLSSEAAAIAVLEMILTTPEWIHRRTERVSFVDGSTTRRRTSVDLTVPFSALKLRPVRSGVSYRLLLIDIAAKVPLVSFDIRNEAGEPIPVLSRTQNGILASNVLTSFAEKVAGDVGVTLTADHVEELDAVACAREDVAAEALKNLREGSLKAMFENSEALDSLAETLVRNFLLVCVVPARIGERRIVKISQEQQQEGVEVDNRPLWLKAAEVFGVALTSRSIPCGSLPDGESYHLEVDAPSQVEIVSSALVAMPDESGSTEAATMRAVDTDAIRILATTAGVHLNVSRAGSVDFDPDSLKGPRLQVAMRVRISTWLVTAFLTTSAVSALFWRTGPLLNQVAPGVTDPLLDQVTPSVTGPLLDQVTPAGTDPAALLAAIVALLLVLVNQPAEHPLSARLLRPARVASLISALLPLVAAWLLAFSGRPGADQWWNLLLVTSLVCWVVTALPFGARAFAWLRAWGASRRTVTGDE